MVGREQARGIPDSIVSHRIMTPKMSRTQVLEMVLDAPLGQKKSLNK